LYVTDQQLDDRYARISVREWGDRKTKDDEAVAGLILSTRYHASDLHVILYGREDWAAAGQGDNYVHFVADGDKTHKPLISLVKSLSNEGAVVLAHDDVVVRNMLNGCAQITVLHAGKGNLIALPYCLASLGAKKCNTLRLLMYETAFMTYEIYDNRLHAEFSGIYCESAKACKEASRVVFKREDDIKDLKSMVYSRNVMRIIHVTPWYQYAQNGHALDWKTFYPNIVFHTARGGEIRQEEEEWSFPRIDYSSVSAALNCSDLEDTFVKLALLTNRIGCMPGKWT
jgi:hypothetical protein